MTPQSILNQCASDGVILSLLASGSVKASGDQKHVDKWLSIIREHKISIIELLVEADNDRVFLDDVFSQEAAQARPDPDDDRRTCRQCANLRAAVCSVARPGGIVSAKIGYTLGQMFREQPHRCEGYTPRF